MNYNITPEIFRKRLIIEGKYNISITDESFVNNFLVALSEELGMSIIAGPFISSATGKTAALHDGFEGSLVWAESGASTYIWSNFNFFTVDIYSCKDFDSIKAVSFIKSKFKVSNFSYFEIPDPLYKKEDTRIYLKEIEGKGLGVFSKDFIPAGTIVSYVDGQIHYAEKESKVFEFASNHAVPFSKYFYRNGFNTKSVKLNHSCDPNCYVKDLFFVTTIRDIQPGEELTYSYSLFCNSDWENPEGLCSCGSSNCFGKILPWRLLPKEYKQKYLPFTADWILFEELKKQGFVEKINLN